MIDYKPRMSLSIGLVNWVELTSIVKSFLTEGLLFVMFSIFWGQLPPSPPFLPGKNIVMNEGRNSLLECVQPFQAYRLGSFPTDNIIHVSVKIIILKKYTNYLKKHHICGLNIITRFLKLTKISYLYS